MTANQAFLDAWMFDQIMNDWDRQRVRKALRVMGQEQEWPRDYDMSHSEEDC